MSRLVAFLFLLLAFSVPALARVDISIADGDPGGLVATYEGRVKQAALLDAQVHIRGKCYSACTLYTMLPPSNLCLDPGAEMWIHHSFDIYTNPKTGKEVRDWWSRDAQRGWAEMKSEYPAWVQAWLRHHPTPNPEVWVVLKGPELHQHFPACSNSSLNPPL